MVKIIGLSHFYSEKKALSDIELELEAGKRYSLLGPNGSGKSTLLKILSTLLKPSSGFVSIDGVALEKKNLHKIRGVLGIAFQNVALDKKLKVIENLRIQASLYGLSRTEAEKKITEVSEYFKLSDKWNELVQKLSGGWQRRVDICKTLLSNPKLLILDEPTTGLDPVSRKELGNYLEQISLSNKTTLLIATHFMEEAERSDVVIFLHNGKKILEGNPREISEKFLGGDLVSVETNQIEKLKNSLKEKFNLDVKEKGKELLFQKKQAHHFIPTLIESFPGEIDSVKMVRPNLENIFFEVTGAALQ